MINSNIQGPWAIIGDLNDILSAVEKQGGREVDLNKCLLFQNRLLDCNLHDMGYDGSPFTWKGQKRLGLCRVCERLDGVVATLNWRATFPKANMRILP